MKSSTWSALYPRAPTQISFFGQPVLSASGVPEGTIIHKAIELARSPKYRDLQMGAREMLV
jgi:hypothetical protein